MIKAFLKSVLRAPAKKIVALASETTAKSFVAAPSPVTCWELYRDYISIHPTAIIAPSASLKIFTLPAKPRIMFEIGAGSHIFSTFALMRPEATVRIGSNSQLGASNFNCADRIEVGDDVLMAWDVTVMDNDSHPLAWSDRKEDVRRCYEDYKIDPQNFIRNKDWSRVAMKPIRIGNRVWIGFGAAILKGVEVGDESVVGAKSVVTKGVHACATVAGNPATELRRS